ncbi:MAG: DUF5683 domain-containing protein [Leptospira sp.]|nr:DUF5683 domain-containing protein [Leptospira sp.]
MKNNFLFILVISIFLNLSISAESYHTIRWKGISSALGYAVEVKDESGKVITQNIKKPTVTIKLNKGKYNYRIAVLNKLNHVEKWSDWHELEVKPVAPPIVDSDTSVVQTDGKNEKITFTSENIYEGTKAFIIQNGKKYPAKIETSADGKTSIVTVDKKLVDPTKDHTVTLENPKYEPIRVAISGELISHPPDTILKPDSDKSDTKDKDSVQFHSETNKSFWSMFWRQSVIPGWGHQYIGHDKTAYTYYALLGGTLINASVQHSNYEAKLASFRTAEDYAEGIRAGTDQTNLLVPIYMNGLDSRVAEQRNRLNQSVAAVGAVYGTAILHIIFTGTKNSMGTRKLSFWEMFWRQAVLPGWGHYAIGEEKTAYMYFGLLGATTVNVAYQNYLYRNQLDEYRTQKDMAESIYAFDPSNLLFPLLLDSKAENIRDQRSRVNNAFTAVGAVYLTSILHIIVTAHFKKYTDSTAGNFSFGLRPDEPVTLSRTIDSNQMRADIRYSFFY